MQQNKVFLAAALVIVAAAVFAGIGGFFGANNESGRVFVDMAKTGNVTAASLNNTIKIGVSAMISPKETLSVYQEIVDYIGDKLGKNATLVQRKTYAEMNELVKNKEVAAAFVCSGPYVNGNEDFGMELIAAPQMYNSTSYYSYIIVNNDSNITRLEELRGKKFAFTDPMSNTGALVPKYMLAKALNETPEAFFGEYIYTKGHDNSIKAVGEKLVDGAAVDHLIWEYINKRNPEITSKTKVIEKLGPFCMPPIVTNPDTDPELKKKMQSILLNMDKDPKGKEIINKIEIDRFVVVENKCYDSVREMVLWEKAQNASNSTK